MLITNNKKVIIYVLLTIFIVVFGWFVYDNSVFRVVSVSPKLSKYTSDTVVVKLNKTIDNNQDIENSFSISPSLFIVVDADGKNITIRPYDQFEANTSYTLVFKEIKSGSKTLNNVTINFKTGDKLKDNLSNTYDLIYKKNLEKYKFMNGSPEFINNNFSISMVGAAETEDPSFILTLTPQDLDYTNQDKKNESFIAAFNEFQDYIEGFGFQYNDLNIKVYPLSTQSLLLKEVHGGIEKEESD